VAKYYYTPFPDHTDRALRATMARYPRLVPIANAANCLNGVAAGDVVYLNAHGIENDANRIQAAHTGPKRRAKMFGKEFGKNVFPGKKLQRHLTVDEVANLMVVTHGLPDGTGAQPIRVKCLVCFAGGNWTHGGAADGEFADQTYARNALAHGCFARALAEAIGGRGRANVLVGGYPGEIRAESRNVSSMVYDYGGVMVEQSSIRVSGGVAWFNRNGEWVDKAGAVKN
jgi:hypothetical protein